MIYAEVDSITQMLYGDLGYLYYGKEDFSVSNVNFLLHYTTCLIQMLTSPFFTPIMFVWFFVSLFQVNIIYFYDLFVLADQRDQYQGIDNYY